MDKTPTASTPGSVVSTGSAASSPYFRRRYEGGTTRREAMEQRFGKSPSNSRPSPSSRKQEQAQAARVSVGPQMPDPSEPQHSVDDNTSGPQSPPKLQPKTSSLEMNSERNDVPSFLPEPSTNSSNHRSNSRIARVVSTDAGDDHHLPLQTASQPQHLQQNDPDIKYYRVVYRGVVALLSGPSEASPRSGAYISYGDVITSSEEILAESATGGPVTPTRNGKSTTTTTPTSPRSPSRKDKLIRVDRVLTGGYTVDAVDSPVEPTAQTPKRGNTQATVAIVGPSPLPLFGSGEEGPHTDNHANDNHSYGYIFAYHEQNPILVRIPQPPQCDYGSFMYRVVSSTPLAVHTGPCGDAPTTKGMLVPGTLHEVCLRVVQSSVTYLRLTRRRGWVVDRVNSPRGFHGGQAMVVMKDVTHETSADDGTVSIASMAASSIATPVSLTRRRHRPPRRKKVRETLDQSTFPRHVPGPATHSTRPHDVSTEMDSSHLNQSVDRGLVVSPSSNISLLSDESSLDQSHSRHAGILTPDRSVARSTASSNHSQHKPSVFLMRVTAPRGLKILDAPHFQVNNLIRGGGGGPSSGSNLSSPAKEAGHNNPSIFQTMAGQHTTTLTSKAGTSAVFDSNTKARRIPRGAVFEASRRMEPPGAFGQSAGLIKLSDNSGWAIVPTREDLDEQYRTTTGSLLGTKEGEASKAYEEVGNAMLDDHEQPYYLRVNAKGGLTVSLQPSSSLASDDETSPTSSAGGSSAIGSLGSTTGSQIRGNDSDVASSVGSSFLDAVFRTPRKKERDSSDTTSWNDGRKDLAAAAKQAQAERVPFSAVIPCGMVAEVERWALVSEHEQQSAITDFARLRGGQGWIPRLLNGKNMADRVRAPETRFGSFWFRVQDRQGIKVRLGPSKRAPSIKSEDGVYFRFECGEFLRASEIVTFFDQTGNAPIESYAKLYRNRHVRLYSGHGVRPLNSLIVQAEWVQIFVGQELFLEECGADPRIERHRQGWRYNVVLDARVLVRKGPSFDADPLGAVLLGGESVLINERVTGPNDPIDWLRLKDGRGWVHNYSPEGNALMIPHALRHRRGPPGRPTKPGKEDQEDIAYNTIIARLFHNDLPQDRGVGAPTKRGLN